MGNNVITEEIDLSKKPNPLKRNEFKFPEYSIKKLKNGINVIIVEDHEQPIIALRVLIPGGRSADGKNPGLASVVAEMITRGAGKRNALQIAEALDGVGASISASAEMDYISIVASSLLKHKNILLEILADIIINPTFPKEELEKVKPILVANIRNEKSKPLTLVSNLNKKVLYGEGHPYSLIATESSVKEIEIKHLKEYHNMYFNPATMCIAVVGDVKEKDILKEIEKYFGKWEQKKPVVVDIPKPKSLPYGVYFINRPGSVQSAICISTLTIANSDHNFYKLDLAGSIIGASFGGRLFRTLREQYAYTYAPFGRVSNYKEYNTFFCGAEVKSEVTDSAISVIQEQLRLLTEEAPSMEEFDRIRKYKKGQYQMNFEDLFAIAQLIQNAHFYKIDFSIVTNYVAKIDAVEPVEMKLLAKEYMNPKRAFIIVVGSSDVLPKLSKFGKCYEYDLDLQPVTGEKGKFEKISITAKELLDGYKRAIGGDAVDNIKSLVINGKAQMDIQGQVLAGTLIQKAKLPLKRFQIADFGLFKQSYWVDEDKVWFGSLDNVEEKKGRDKEKLRFEAHILPETKLLELGLQCVVLGKQNDLILLKASASWGMDVTYYFDAKSYLLVKSETTETTPEGTFPITRYYLDYKQVGDLLLPSRIKTESPFFILEVENFYEINVEVEDSEFSPPLKH